MLAKKIVLQKLYKRHNDQNGLYILAPFLKKCKKSKKDVRTTPEKQHFLVTYI